MRFAIFRRPLALLLTLAVILTAGRAEAQMHQGVELVHADLLADTTTITPGKPFTVGLRLKMEPHWHTYWQYSGDAGLPTKIAWHLPEGFKAGPILWPVPETITSPGDIINYGYSGEVVLLTEITPPATLPPGEVTLAGKADWLVCAEICVPGKAELSLKLPTGDAQPANADVFQKYRDLLPKPYDFRLAKFIVTPLLHGNEVIWNLGLLHAKDKDAVEFYPLPPDSVQVGHPVIEVAPEHEIVLPGSNMGSSLHIRLPVTDGLVDVSQLQGVIVLRRDGQPPVGWIIPAADLATKKDYTVHSTVPKGIVPDTSPAPKNTATPTTTPAVSASIWHFLLLGFLGGLILNVMPCVLPVISLKLFSFVKQANESPERVLRLGLAYAAGVFAWFLGFAALVVILKTGGREVGYSFQLGNRWFLVGLSAFTFVFALNLMGVFEIILPGSVSNAAGNAARREGYMGAFVQGVLATILGSACTAPLLGEALGFAFTASAPVVFAMFTAIAAGMSAPFVLLAAQPRWLRFLPKPGEWMERVKQGTGFLLLATVLWLLWCLRGRGADTIIWSGALLLVLAVACWVQGAFNTLVAGDRARWTARAVIALVVFGGGWFCVDQIAQAQPPSAVGTGGAVAFTTQLDSALKTGRLVFVDFTADWCVSCKVNEKAVLASAPVQAALRDRGAVFLRADYTFFPDDITRLLRRFKRAGVPLYVIFPAGKPDAPVVMPELLTQQVVLDAFAEADHRATATAIPIAAR